MTKDITQSLRVAWESKAGLRSKERDLTSVTLSSESIVIPVSFTCKGFKPDFKSFELVKGIMISSLF
ncbi:hypothetical protein ACLK29_05430 [Leptospira kirschneri]|uniref:hypothetical protein n=1 Tax=Leptospira kirschneri TaxID=29507 RepID=UPI0002BEECED|nr:hypothetical protein [Leptospira kirschneri]EMJ93801.1 hypothetical protein LEP1GSC198_2455 [Leptospira kirschneri str. JB]